MMFGCAPAVPVPALPSAGRDGLNRAPEFRREGEEERERDERDAEEPQPRFAHAATLGSTPSRPFRGSWSLAWAHCRSSTRPCMPNSGPGHLARVCGVISICAWLYPAAFPNGLGARSESRAVLELAGIARIGPDSDPRRSRPGSGETRVLPRPHAYPPDQWLRGSCWSMRRSACGPGRHRSPYRPGEAVRLQRDNPEGPSPMRSDPPRGVQDETGPLVSSIWRCRPTTAIPRLSSRTSSPPAVAPRSLDP